MLICQKVSVVSSPISVITDKVIEKVISETRRSIIDILKKLQKVEAELTILDIKNIAIAEFFVVLKDYYEYNSSSKKLILDNLKNFLNNIENIVGEFEITKKRNGWWSELYRQKWDINKQ